MRLTRLLVAGAAAVVLVATAATPSGAVWDPGLGGARGTGANTEMVMSGTGPGQGVNGFLGPVGSVSDPSVAYPTSIPAGFTSQPEGFAGIILGTPTQPPNATPLQMYCINIRTNTNVGIGYELGDWTAANVNNVGFVARLLNRYFPNTTLPPGLTDSQKAAAVQAAIWYFADNYVLDPNDPLRSTVETIVNTVRILGPLVQPPPPDLQITPATVNGSTGVPTGPFTVTTGGVNAVVRVDKGQMFSDAAGTQPIANLTAVASGTAIWVTDASAGTVTLSAAAVASVPSGNVYLYDNNSSGIGAAQKLILAAPGVVTTTVTAAAQLTLPGSLTVTKTIGGSAAGQQGEIHIDVSCDGVGLEPFIIPAGTTGTPSHTYDGLLAGATCTITETTDGSTATIGVVTVPAGPATISPGSTVPAAISDEYTVGTTTSTTSTTSTTIEDTTIPDTVEDTVEAETLPPTGTGSGTVPGAPIAALLLIAGGGVVLLVRRRASG